MKIMIKCECGNQFNKDYSLSSKIFDDKNWFNVFQCLECGQVFYEKFKEIKYLK